MPSEQHAATPDPKTEQILAASREIFLELGYAGTSMDLVAQRARVSKTTLYTRFPSKDELYVATISAECERSGLHFAPDTFDDVPLEEALRALGRRFVDLIWSEAAIRMHQSVTGEATRVPQAARLFFQAGPEKAIATFVAFFERAAARGLIKTDDPAFVATQFLATMQGGVHCALMLGACDTPEEAEREAYVAKAVALFIRGLA
ncbi:TetR/AcrR family transcriptional regulator [Azospirillum sp. TSO22-1]|uniref:TetR/AcrR family transcriptional regulator n=1 Tax=Azospirillum sp. TSO22-1 TaxID=716789 RepID=UPI000D603580|nr:TetR/AcrR family transcriptional regulator [Azospirillum sp. TSO22-1]PWC54955.1 TetR family transcriptional regulator [Azospirillum sp. TSO22-1]